MIQEEEIVGIMQKKLEGKLTAEETAKFNEWLAIPANAASFSQYKLIWTTTNSLAEKKENFTPNSTKSWMAIEALIEADKPKRRRKLSYLAAASVALLIMVFAANYIFNGRGDTDNIQYVLQTNEKDTLTFSDGSQAYLFGPCSISYPKTFAANERIISMYGFVYFDIARDENRPFEINTDNGKVTVLGTSFTVDSRQNGNFTVQCITGKVKMTAFENGKEYNTILTKNLKGTYNSSTDQLVATAFDKSDLSIELPARNMVFSNKPLREIIERIESAFDVTIQLENKDLLETKYSTTINDSTLDDFLNELKITYKVEVIQTSSEKYILKGGSSN